MTLTVIHVEANQAIQSEANDVLLIAGKGTAMRFFFQNDEPMQLSAQLELVTPGGAKHLVAPLNAVKTDVNLPLALQRLSDSTGLTFLVPGSMLQDGITRFRLTGVMRLDLPGTLSLDGVSEWAFSFVQVPPMRLELIGFSYRAGNPPETLEPSEFDRDMILSWLKRVFPISELDVRYRLATSILPPLSNPLVSPNSERKHILGRLQDIRAMDADNDPATFYLGLVHYDPGGLLRGDSSIAMDDNGRAIAGDLNAVAFSMVGPRSFNWDLDGSSADWYAGHELSHLCGRRHSARCRNSSNDDDDYPNVAGRIGGGSDGEDARDVGYDFGDPNLNLNARVMHWKESHDVTTYCDHIWISSYTYRAIRTFMQKLHQIDDESPTAGALVDLRTEVVGTEGVFVRGTVNRETMEGSIGEVLPLSVGPMSESNPDSDSHLRILTAKGVVQDFGLRLMPPMCRYADEPLVESFSVRLQTPSDVVEIKLLTEGRILDALSFAEVTDFGAEGAELEEAFETISAAATEDTRGGRARPSVRSAKLKYIVRGRENAESALRTLAITTEPPIRKDVALDVYADSESAVVEVVETDGLKVLRTWELTE